MPFAFTIASMRFLPLLPIGKLFFEQFDGEQIDQRLSP